MTVLTIIILLIFAVTFLAAPGLGDGWFWEIGNGLGFAGFAGLLFQMIPSTRSRTARRHEVLGYWVLGVGMAHAFWFLSGDGAVRAYLQPGAPLYMWLGLLGLTVMAVLTVLARMPDRIRVHARYHSFRTAHRLLGFIAAATTGLHILMSGFYLSVWWQRGFFGLLILICCFGWRGRTAPGRPSPVSGWTYALISVVAITLFVLIRNITP